MLQILVPTDFSDNSYNALFYAANFFEQRECKFHILHAYDIDDNLNQTPKELKKRTLEGLRAIRHRVIRDVGKNDLHEFLLVPEHLDLLQVVSNFIEKQPIDFMVIGNKGKNQTKAIFLGNNAMQLVREVTSCPILIVPLEIDFKPPKKIAFISDYKYAISQGNRTVLTFINSLSNAKIIPMTIDDHNTTEMSTQHKTDFYNVLSEYITSEVKLPVLNNKTNTILEFVQQWNIDMVVMIYYPHHFFLEFIGKGIIRELNFKLRLPFLILPKSRN